MRIFAASKASLVLIRILFFQVMTISRLSRLLSDVFNAFARGCQDIVKTTSRCVLCIGRQEIVTLRRSSRYVLKTSSKHPEAATGGAL